MPDIWRIINLNMKHYTFRQQHSSGFIQRKSDFFFIYNVLQQSLKNPSVLVAFSTDHSQITFSLSGKSEEATDKGF